nr:hypothetical protein [Bacteroidales bacterium]
MKKVSTLLVITLLLQIFATSLSAQENQTEDQVPMYMLSYDHGGLILWGGDHFSERLQNAASWLEKYPEFKIGLDNEAHMYDYLADHEPKLLQE